MEVFFTFFARRSYISEGGSVQKLTIYGSSLTFLVHRSRSKRVFIEQMMSTKVSNNYPQNTRNLLTININVSNKMSKINSRIGVIRRLLN